MHHDNLNLLPFLITHYFFLILNSQLPSTNSVTSIRSINPTIVLSSVPTYNMNHQP